jgi:hypothetical protein
MTIIEMMQKCLSRNRNTISIEQPRFPNEPNIVLFQGLFSYDIPLDILNKEVLQFSISSKKVPLSADIVFFVEEL